MMSVIQNLIENGIGRDMLWRFMKLMLKMTLSARKATRRQVLVSLSQRRVLSLMHPMMILKMKLVTMLINHSYVGIVEKSFQLKEILRLIQIWFMQTKDTLSVMYAEKILLLRLIGRVMRKLFTWSKIQVLLTLL